MMLPSGEAARELPIHHQHQPPPTATIPTITIGIISIAAAPALINRRTQPHIMLSEF